MSKRNENRPGYKKTKVGWVPEDWEVKPLRSVGLFSKGKGISNSDKKETGIPCITYGEIYTKHDFNIKEFQSFIDTETTKTSQRIKKNDILFAGSGETLDDIGKCVAYTKNVEAYAGGDIIIFSPTGVESVYLSYSLNSDLITRHKRRLGQGHSVVHIYSSGLKTLHVPFPPLPEQKKIAKILSIWDQAIEQTCKLIDAKKRRKKALMQQLLTGKKRMPVFATSKGSTSYRFFDLPKDWECLQIRNIAQEYSERYFGYPSNHIEEGSIGLLLSHDIGIVSPIYTVFQCDDSVIPEYLYAVFKTDTYRHIFAISTNASVDRRGSLRWREFSLIRTPLPSKKEQQAIVDVLSIADREIAQLNTKLKAFKKQKRGLMQKLLTGEVRVKP